MHLPVLIGPITLGVYAGLLSVGGVVGFVKAGSRPSLIAGFVCGALAIVALAFDWTGQKQLGNGLGAALSLTLIALFSQRFSTTKKFMPSGLMALVSLVVLIIMAALLMQGGPVS